MRFAILSNFVPVTPTGQTIVLHRLLEGLSSDQYYVICSEPEDTEVNVALPKLNTKYYYLDAPQRGQWTSPWDMAQRAYRHLQGHTGLIENFIRLRARQISDIMRQDPCCALIACTSDLIRLPSASIACAESDVPFIPYIMDDYAYSLAGWEREFALRYDQNMMKKAAQVILLTEAMAKVYQQRYHISTTSVVHTPTNIRDPKDIQRFPPVLDKDAFNIVFSGSLYHAHYDAVRNMTQAIASLPEKRVKLHLFTDKTAEQLAAEGIEGEFLVCHSFVSQAEILSILLEADLLFLPLAFQSSIQDGLRLAAPSKTGDYLAVGKPILVHAPADSFIAQYFRQHECGLVVDEPDIAQLAQVISDVVAGKIDVERLVQRARQRAEADFIVEPVRASFIKAVEKGCRATP